MQVGIMPAGSISRATWRREPQRTLTYERSTSSLAWVSGNPRVLASVATHHRYVIPDAIKMFNEDRETHAIILIGEIAQCRRNSGPIHQANVKSQSSASSPVRPRSRPPHGHAGAIISGDRARQRQIRGHGRS